MKSKSTYGLEVLLTLLHFTPLNKLGILFGSALIFYHVAFRNRVDLVSIFILLMPAIIFAGMGGDSSDGMGIFYKILTTFFQYAFPLGPLMISTKFAAAMAVPVRLLFTFHQQKNRWLTLIWFIGVFIAMGALYLAVKDNIQSAGGITVGFRSMLSIGAILIPLSVDPKTINTSLKTIIKISFICLLFGVTRGHWGFIVTAFATLVLFTKIELPYKIIGLLIVINYLVGGATFTYLLIILFTFLFLFLIKVLKTHIITTKKAYLAYATFPIIFIGLVFISTILPILELIGSQHFVDKLVYDRGAVWFGALNLISDSNFWIVPSARPFYVINMLGSNAILEWEAGAHNIFIEMARQNGAFSSIIMLVLFIGMFMKYLPKINFQKNSLHLYVLFSLIPVYMVFGFTGQSIIYDGVGFMFWLLFGQLLKIGNNFPKAFLVLK